MEEEIRKLKEFILINVCGVYFAEDIDKEFEERLNQNKKYIEEYKKELPDNAISNNSQN